jgi:hypothetical protein
MNSIGNFIETRVYITGCGYKGYYATTELETSCLTCIYAISEKLLREFSWNLILKSNTKRRDKGKVVPVHAKKIVFSWVDSPSGPMPPLWGSSITLRHTTLGRTHLDEWSARRGDYLTIHNTHKRQTSIPRQDSNPQSQQASGRRSKP